MEAPGCSRTQASHAAIREASTSPTVSAASGSGIAEIDLIHPAPLELAQQAREPPLETPQVAVVPKARLERDAGHARLLRIELPRVEIEHGRQPRLGDEPPDQ